MVDVLVEIKKRQKNTEAEPISIDEEGDMEVMTFMLECINDISSVRLNLPNNLTTKENKLLVKETIKEVKNIYLIKIILGKKIV